MANVSNVLTWIYELLQMYGNKEHILYCSTCESHSVRGQSVVTDGVVVVQQLVPRQHRHVREVMSRFVSLVRASWPGVIVHHRGQLFLGHRRAEKLAGNGQWMLMIHIVGRDEPRVLKSSEKERRLLIFPGLHVLVVFFKEVTCLLSLGMYHERLHPKDI